jgi:Protein of unknown function (DUF3099)
MKFDRKKPLVTTSITSAGDPLSVDQSSRARRYFISMMIRTICFIATVILPSPYRWATLLGAVLLPYIAVVIANAGRENSNSAQGQVIPSREIGNEKPA